MSTDGLTPRRRSCAACNKSKIKCIGGPPCRHCIEANIDCLNQGPGPKSLLHRVASLEKDRMEMARSIKQLQAQLRSISTEVVPPRQGPLDLSSGYEEPDERISPAEEEDAAGSFSGQGNIAESQSDLPEAVDEEDITLIDTIRFGKRREYDDVGSGEEERLKKKRFRLNSREEESVEMTLEEQLALDIFFTRCSPKLPFILRDELDIHALRKSGSTLYWTMIAAGSREAQEISSLHSHAEALSIRLSRETLFGRQPTTDDIKGLLINWMFLSEARSPGHVVGIAHDLGLSSLCGKLCRRYEGWKRGVGIVGSGGEGFTERTELRALLRLDGYLYMVDRITAAVTDRPHLINRDDTARTTAYLLDFADKRITDTRLVAQVEVADMMANVRSAFSQSPFFHDNITLIPMYDKLLDRWMEKWNTATEEWSRSLPRAAVEGLASSLRFIYDTARLYINAFPLQGIHSADQLSPTQMRCLNTCVVSARSVCRGAVINNQPNNVIYASNMTQFQLTFAAVFLLRMMRLLPGEFEEAVILNEISDLATLLSTISGGYYANRIHQMLRHMQQLKEKERDAASQRPGATMMLGAEMTSWGQGVSPAILPMEGMLDWEVPDAISALWDREMLFGGEMGELR